MNDQLADDIVWVKLGCPVKSKRDGKHYYLYPHAPDYSDAERTWVATQPCVGYASIATNRKTNEITVSLMPTNELERE